MVLIGQEMQACHQAAEGVQLFDLYYSIETVLSVVCGALSLGCALTEPDILFVILDCRATRSLWTV